LSLNIVALDSHQLYNRSKKKEGIECEKQRGWSK